MRWILDQHIARMGRRPQTVHPWAGLEAWVDNDTLKYPSTLCGSCGSANTDDAVFCLACGEPSESAELPDRWLGTTIAGRFTLLARLGEGGIGRVYLAEQPMGNATRKLAVKMLLPRHSSKPDMVQRFLRECELLSRIEHANVVRIYDFGEAEPRTFFIAMELVQGEPLSTLLQREGSLSIWRAARLTGEIGRAVAAAHDVDVVHRDLKPDNVMVLHTADAGESVKVLDFGIAKAIQQATDAYRPLETAVAGNVTSAGSIVGTPRYMSPEQFLGTRVDARTDIYALGLMAYEMVTGVAPFDANSAAGWATAHVAGTPRAFDATAGGALVTNDLRAVILSALEKNPDNRPSTMRDFVASLAAASQPQAPFVQSSLPPPSHVRESDLELALAPTAGDVAGHSRNAPASSKPGEKPSRRWPLIGVTAVAVVCVGLLLRAWSTPSAADRCATVLEAKTCADATSAMQQCPESAKHAHEHAHVYRDSLCGE